MRFVVHIIKNCVNFFGLVLSYHPNEIFVKKSTKALVVVRREHLATSCRATTPRPFPLRVIHQRALLTVVSKIWHRRTTTVRHFDWQVTLGEQFFILKSFVASRCGFFNSNLIFDVRYEDLEMDLNFLKTLYLLVSTSSTL